MEGSGFFAPDGGEVDFSIDIPNNSFEVVACKTNFGLFQTGILDLTSILNQPYVMDTQSF